MVRERAVDTVNCGVLQQQTGYSFALDGLVQKRISALAFCFTQHLLSNSSACVSPFFIRMDMG